MRTNRRRSSRIRRVVLAGLTLAVVCDALLETSTANAQGVVGGTVRILEKGPSPSKDVSDAVVYLDGDGVVVRPGSSLDNATVLMKGREFVPHVQIVRAGGNVAYPNKDPFSHNVFSNSALGAFDLGLYRTNASRAVPFSRAGVYSIYCNIHARMVSFVVAVPTPWVATAKDDGQFSIANVPAGTYRLHAWHERTPEAVRDIVVTATGLSGVSLTLDARGYVARPHLNKFGAPYAITRADRY